MATVANRPKAAAFGRQQPAKSSHRAARAMTTLSRMDLPPVAARRMVKLSRVGAESAVDLHQNAKGPNLVG